MTDLAARTAEKAAAARERRNARIMTLVDEKLSERQIAKRLGVSRSTVWSVKQAAKPKKGKKRG